MSLLEALLEPVTNGGLFLELLWQLGLVTMLAASLDLVTGYAGMFQLGHVGFFALGAAGSTFGTHPDYLGLDLFGGILFGIALTTLACVAIGVPTLRLTGDYFAIATLGFGIIVQVILVGFWARGVFGVPTVNPFGCDLACMANTPAGALGDAVSRLLTGESRPEKGLELIIVWSVAALTFWLMGRIKRSPFGRVLKSIREDRHAAAALGKNVPQLRFAALWISAAVASIVGSFWVHHLRNLEPSFYGFQVMVILLVMVILGGLGSNAGALVGAALVLILDQTSRSVTAWMDDQSWSGGADMPSLRLLLFAVVLLAVMLAKPTGILGDREVTLRQIIGKIRSPRKRPVKPTEETP